MIASYPKSINVKGKLITFYEPKIMGILNVTPDSFFDGGLYSNQKQILKRVEQLLIDGADIIDIGGYSSRPGAKDISDEEELQRVIPVIQSILKHFPNTCISIDSFRASVVQEAVDAGASIVNDISGGSLDARMFETVAKANVPYILMHMKGTPQTMKNLDNYDNLILDVIDYFQQKILTLRELGQKDIILDLGFGFAKNISQNFSLLKQLKSFELLNLPMLVGVSRKSMIYKTLGIEAKDALNGTSILNTIALLNNANVLRVHDVKEANELKKLVLKYQSDI